MTPQNYNWFIHTMLSFHTRKVIARQAKKQLKECRKRKVMILTMMKLSKQTMYITLLDKFWILLLKYQMFTEYIWQVTLSLFSDLFIKIAHCILSTLLYLYCLEIHRKSVGSPSEVRWTENLASMTGFCLCPLEIRRKYSGCLTDTKFQPVQPFLASKWFEWTFTGLCPD